METVAALGIIPTMLSTYAARQNATRWLPAIIAGLAVGRVTSELLRPGPFGAILITAAAVLLALLFLGRRPLAQTWPGLLPIVYLVQPEASPRLAASAAGMATIAWLLGGSGLRLRPAPDQRRLALAAALLLFLGFLALYLLTLAPGLLPADSGEFQLVAAELGVAHPPGFPLYTLLAHLFAELPLGPTPAYRVNVLSALLAAATLALVYEAVRQLTGRASAGLLAAVALGTATTFWAQATTANIRTLTAFFTAAAFFALVRLRSADARTDGRVSREGWLLPATLLGAAVVFGVAHHGSLIFIAMVMGIYLLMAHRSILAHRRLWFRWAAVAGLALLPLAYLPLRAAAGAWGAPDDLVTPGGFANHVLALGFRGDLFAFTSPAELGERLKVMLNVLSFQFEPTLLAAIVAGLALMAWRDRRLAFLVGGTFLVHTLVAATYRAPQTVEYIMPAYIPAAMTLGYLAGSLQEVRSSVERALALVATALLFVAAGGQLADGWSGFRLAQTMPGARDEVLSILEQAPADSLVLADWHWATPLWYLQQVEGLRPDLEIRFVFPGSDPYAQTWARRIAEGLDQARPVVATHFQTEAFAALPPALPLDGFFLYPAAPLEELPTGYQPLDLSLGDAVRLLGFRLETPSIALGQEAILTLAWEAGPDIDQGTSLFAHLVSEEQALLAQADVSALAQPVGLTLTRFSLTPRPGTIPGTYDLVIGAYGSAPLLDAAGRDRVTLAAIEVTAAGTPLATGNAVYRPLANGSRTLIGYDWDDTLPGHRRLYLHWRSAEGYYTEVREDRDGPADIGVWIGPWGLAREADVQPAPGPSNYVPFGQGLLWVGDILEPDRRIAPGQRTALTQRFLSSLPVDRDLVVSVRLVGYDADGQLWAWWDLQDGVPGLGAVPTLKWMPGSAVRDPHFVTVSPSASEGQSVGALLRIYDAFTGQPLPILDERIAGQFPWVPLGTSTVGAAP